MNVIGNHSAGIAEGGLRVLCCGCALVWSRESVSGESARLWDSEHIHTYDRTHHCIESIDAFNAFNAFQSSISTLSLYVLQIPYSFEQNRSRNNDIANQIPVFRLSLAKNNWFNCMCSQTSTRGSPQYSALRPTQEPLTSQEYSYLESKAFANRHCIGDQSQCHSDWAPIDFDWLRLTDPSEQSLSSSDWLTSDSETPDSGRANCCKMMDSLTDQLCLQDLVAATSVGSHGVHHQTQSHHHAQHHHNVQIPDTTTHMQSSGAVQSHNNSPVSALTAPSFASPHHHVTTLLPTTMSSHHHHLHHLNHLSSAQTMGRTGLLTANGTDQQPCSTTIHENNKQKRGMLRGRL